MKAVIRDRLRAAPLRRLDEFLPGERVAWNGEPGTVHEMRWDATGRALGVVIQLDGRTTRCEVFPRALRRI